MLRSRAVVSVVLLGLGSLMSATAAEAPILWTSGDVKWTDLAEPAGAREASLWHDPATGDRGTLVRWKFNTKVPARAADQDTHIVVLAGTFVLELEGASYPGEPQPDRWGRRPQGARRTGEGRRPVSGDFPEGFCRSARHSRCQGGESLGGSQP